MNDYIQKTLMMFMSNRTIKKQTKKKHDYLTARFSSPLFHDSFSNILAFHVLEM